VYQKNLGSWIDNAYDLLANLADKYNFLKEDIE